jgi:hypothetical protein
MKKIAILFTLIAALIYVSCKDNSTNVTTSSSDLKLNGKIVNWNNGSSKYLIVSITKIAAYSPHVIDSSIIGLDGSFSLTIKAPADSLLDTLRMSVCSGNVTFSKPGAKGGMLYLTVDSAGTSMGHLYRSNYNEDSINIINPPVGFYSTYNLYSDLDVSVTGSDTCIYYDTSIAAYNLSISNGWNIMCGFVTFSSNTKTIFNVTGQEPAGGKWYYSTAPIYNVLNNKPKDQKH